MNKLPKISQEIINSAMNSWHHSILLKDDVAGQNHKVMAEQSMLFKFLLASAAVNPEVNNARFGALITLELLRMQMESDEMDERG